MNIIPKVWKYTQLFMGFHQSPVGSLWVAYMVFSCLNKTAATPRGEFSRRKKGSDDSGLMDPSSPTVLYLAFRHMLQRRVEILPMGLAHKPFSDKPLKKPLSVV
jgi:hypothetical protein